MKIVLPLQKTQGLFAFLFLFAFLLCAQRSNAQIPTITSFSPLSSDIGAAVTITGTNFDATAANNIVFFGATRATVSAASTTTSLIVTVPIGATHAAITVLNTITSKIGYSSAFFRPKPSSQKSGFTATDLELPVDLTGIAPAFVAIGDIDSDGLSDIMATNSTDNTVSVFRNTSTTGSVSFAAKVDFGTGGGPRHVSIGDIDGDGRLDLAVTNATSGNISLLRNTSSSGTISFAAKEDIVAGSAPLETVIGDLDDDGRNDLAAIVPVANITLFRNIGSPGSFNFGAGTSYSVGGFNGASISIGDLNGDGLPDLAVGKTNGGVSVFRNTSTLGTISFDTPQTFAAIGFVRSVSIGDIDGDGLPDLTVLGSVATNVYILRNTSSGAISFAAATAISVPSTSPQGQSLTTSDMDGDGKLDIIVGRTQGADLTVGRNTSTVGNITFDAPVHFATGSTDVQRLAVGDLDGDGLPDVALSRVTSAVVSLFRNGPAITVNSPTLAAVNTTYGTASGTTIFTVAGIGVASGITITPPAGFELSKTAGGASGFAGAGTAITVTGKGTIAATTIYMRLVSSTSVGLYSGNIVSTAGSATQTTASVASTVSAATLTITANNANKNYGAAALSGGAGSTAFTTTGLQNSETIGSVTIIYTAGVGKGNTLIDGVATYIGSVVPSAATGGSFNAANYTISYAPGNIIVNPVPLTITASNANRNYGSVLTGGAGSTAFITVGLQNSETIGSVTIVYATGAGNGNDAADPVATYTDKVTPGAATGGSFSAANYTINYASGNIIVNPVPLTINASNANRNYGSVLTGGAGSTAFTSVGLKNSETIGSVTIAYTSGAGNGNDAADPVATYTGKVTPGAATGGSFNAANYTISYAPGNLTVNPATLTITANNNSKTYRSVLTGGTGSTAFAATGLQNSETIGSVTLGYTAGGNTATSAAGVYPGTITPSLATGGTFTPGNYTISYTPGNLIVNKAALIITAADKIRVFGASEPVFTANYSGFLNGDTEAGLSTQPTFSTNATAASAAGNYIIMPSGAVSANYTPSYVNGVLTILPFVNQAPTLAAIANQVICYTPALQSIALSGITPGPESSQITTLSVSSSNNSMFSNLSITGGNGSNGTLIYSLNPGVSGTVVITVTVKDNGGMADGGVDTFIRTFTVTINPEVVASISSSTGATLSKGLTATLTASGGTGYQWGNANGIISGQNTSILTIRPLVTTTYTVAVSNASGCNSTQSITITVNDDYKSLDALNAITPNGDGKNDTWTIRNIDAYPNNMVKVFDRAGRLVYNKKGYNNDWDGSYNGLPLQQGTYYFVVELGIGSTPMKGFISIVRQ